MLKKSPIAKRLRVRVKKSDSCARLCKLLLSCVGFCSFSQPMMAQRVKLAKIALGMSDVEVKAALASEMPFYAEQPSAYADMVYLIAETDAESYLFTLINRRTVGFSVVHLLPPGQLPFLRPGQQPTVAVLRDLISKQTWEPAEMIKGDAWWFSDAAGLPLKDATQCRPGSGAAWSPVALISSATPGQQPPKSTVGLLQPSVTSYPSNCGVSIHLNQSPAEDEHSVVTSVRYQVLDMKAMNTFVMTHAPDNGK